MGKPTMWFPTRSDTNRPVQLQKQARNLKCTIQVAKTKVTAKLICVFVFAYADCWFSHGVAHIIVLSQLKLFSKFLSQPHSTPDLYNYSFTHRVGSSSFGREAIRNSDLGANCLNCFFFCLFFYSV